MSFRDILVHLKSHEDWSPHIDHAINTAKLYSSHLRALVTFHEVVMLRNLPRYAGKGLELQIEKDAEIAKHLKAKFMSACAEAGVAASFDIAEGAAGELLPWAARLHDLTIIEQRQPDVDELGFDAAEETALSAGRPVLLVPRRGHFQPTPEHILVAWNGSAMAASAVQGALPFIQRAKKVTICSGELRLPLRPGSRIPDISLSSHLKRHVAEVTEEKTQLGPAMVGEHLLDRANELGCGMIVMGAFGRSWFSEYLLGGATRHMLKHMTVPILTGR
jgi:nucleotide-binding universal stress UspA family protein